MPTSRSALSLTRASAFGNDEEDAAAPVSEGPPSKKLRPMEQFASQLQRQQAEREERLRGKLPEGKSVSSVLAMTMGAPRAGSHASSIDLATTNLCVLNLPGNVTERTMGEYFAQWGDVATVKVSSKSRLLILDGR